MPQSRDYFAELYVAGILGDCGWSVYFPKRDVGFDFIITKQVEERIIVRPVQVKGKYPEEEKEEKKVYGYIGALSQVHPEMVLAIPFFPTDRLGVAPVCTAYVPFWRISPQASRGYACQPVVWRGALPTPRQTYRRFFDFDGIRAMETLDWSVRPTVEEFNVRRAKNTTIVTS
jgi:hypothetical protein